MKRLLLTILLSIYSISNAQFNTKNGMDNLVNFDEQQFSWGYYLGINMFDLKVHPSKTGMNESYKQLVEVKPQMGFTAGLIGRWRLDDDFDFRAEPAIHFAQRELIFWDIKDMIESEPGGEHPIFTDSDTSRKIKSTYVDIPVFINFHGWRFGNTRPYFQAGVSWLVNMQSNEKKKEDNLDGKFRMKTHNFSYQLEAGVEIYFKRFKLTPSVRGIFFFNNELVKDNEGTPPVWAGSMKSVSTRAFLFSVKFE